MPVPFLIIDGYNLLHAAGLARATYGPGDLARVRRELLVKLARRLRADEQKRCCVVFDAIDAPANLPNRFKHQEIQVLFAQPGHEADEVIETLIRQHSAPKRITVVSSDHRLQTAAHRRGGIGLDSDLFLKQLESPDRQIGPAHERPGAASPPSADLDLWLHEFADVSPQQLDKDLVAESKQSKSDWNSQIEQLQQRLDDPESLDDWLSDHRGPPRKPTS